MRHRESKKVSFTIYVVLLLFLVFLIIYFLNYTVGAPDNWTMAATVQDLEAADYSAVVSKRTKDRGRVASIMQVRAAPASLTPLLPRSLHPLSPSIAPVAPICRRLCGCWGTSIDPHTQSLTFSAIVNATLDKIGKIDPATSTVLIGMFLGNTFGFVLDTMLASDEGLREYLWSPPAGMRYALGSLLR